MENMESFASLRLCVDVAQGQVAARSVWWPMVYFLPRFSAWMTTSVTGDYPILSSLRECKFYHTRAQPDPMCAHTFDGCTH